MKILWLSRWDSRNPTDGQLVYSEGLISSLEHLGADIHVIATARTAGAPMTSSSSRTIVAPSVWPRAFSLMTNISSDSFKQRSTAFRESIESALTDRPDVIIFDYYATGWMLEHIQDFYERMGKDRPFLVYLSHNHEASLRPKVAQGYSGNALKKWAVRHDAEKAAAMENQLAAACDLICAITDQDSAQYQRDFPDKSHLTILPGYTGSVREPGHISESTPRRVIMMGSLLWIAKQESIRRFILAARQGFEDANIEFLVLGRAEPDFLQSIEALSPSVRAVGFVDDPLPFLHASRIGLMPDELGGGFKLRIMDYIFNGVPVAAIRSQAEGLPLNGTSDMLTADGATELAQAIIANIDDIGRLNEMATQAQAKCSGKFDWENRSKMLVKTIEMGISSASGRS